MTVSQVLLSEYYGEFDSEGKSTKRRCSKKVNVSDFIIWIFSVDGIKSLLILKPQTPRNGRIFTTPQGKRQFYRRIGTKSDFARIKKK